MYRTCRPSSVWLRCVIEDLEIRCAEAEVARRTGGERGAGVRQDAFEQCWAVGSPSKSRHRRETFTRTAQLRSRSSPVQRRPRANRTAIRRLGVFALAGYRRRLPRTLLPTSRSLQPNPSIPSGG